MPLPKGIPFLERCPKCNNIALYNEIQSELEPVRRYYECTKCHGKIRIMIENPKGHIWKATYNDRKLRKRTGLRVYG